MEHEQTRAAPHLDWKSERAVADALKVNVDVVFVKKLKPRQARTQAFGVANLYDSVEQAKLIEPEYIVKRNIPPEKPKEEKKE